MFTRALKSAYSHLSMSQCSDRHMFAKGHLALTQSLSAWWSCKIAPRHQFDCSSISSKTASRQHVHARISKHSSCKDIQAHNIDFLGFILAARVPTGRLGPPGLSNGPGGAASMAQPKCRHRPARSGGRQTGAGPGPNRQK